MSGADRTRPLPVLLVAEPDFLVRDTVAGVMRSQQLARVRTMPSLQAAQQLLDSVRVDFMLLALDEERTLLGLLQALRGGRLLSVAATPVAVMAGHAHGGLVMELKALDVQRLLLKPYKIKTLLQTLETMAQSLPTQDLALQD